MEHLARWLRFSRYNDAALIAMFTSYTAYFDASGHPDDHKIMTVGGFVSTVKKWARFDREWNAILQSEGVNSFRMSEFASSEGEFRAWKGQTERRRKFVEQLTDCLRKNVNKAFRSSLNIYDYDEVNAEYKLEEAIGRPYAACGTECLMALEMWRRRKRIDVKHVLCFFESGDKDKGNFEEQAKKGGRFQPLRPEFLSKERAVAFQAADFSAWKYRTAFQESSKPDHDWDKAAKLFTSLSPLMKIPHDGSGIHNKEQLLRFCQMSPFVEKR